MSKKHYNWSKKRITAKEEADKKNKAAEIKARLESKKAMEEAANKTQKSPLQNDAEEDKKAAAAAAAGS